jgi:sugar phosphate isomerase/epimerase
LTEDPATAAKYAGEVPGLGYTLDPGHFVVGDHPTDEPWRELLDDVVHVHVRQAGSGWDEIQLPPDAGELDVAAFVQSLRQSGYDGVLTVEYIDALDGVDPEAAERQADEMRARLAASLE